MTKKDYKMIAWVFNQKMCENEAKNNMSDNLYSQMYYAILCRMVNTLKADNPKFNADKFMQEVR